MEKNYKTKTIRIHDIKKMDDGSYIIIDTNRIEYRLAFLDMDLYIGQEIDIRYTEPVSIFGYPTIQDIYYDTPDSEILSEIGVDQYGFTHFR